MDFLLLLKEMRTPFLDNLFLLITFLGDEALFTAVVLLFLWCLDKRTGYFMFYTFLLGACTNQILKNIFCVPRPWIVNPAIEPVEFAVEKAAGYSFPSGHTQSAAGLFGSLAVSFRKWWLDERYIRYDIRGPLWWQAVKYVLGLGSTLILLILLKAPTVTLLHDHPAAYTVRYFIIILWAGAVYPLLFSLVAIRLPLKRSGADD